MRTRCAPHRFPAVVLSVAATTSIFLASFAASDARTLSHRSNAAHASQRVVIVVMDPSLILNCGQLTLQVWPAHNASSKPKIYANGFMAGQALRPPLTMLPASVRANSCAMMPLTLPTGSTKFSVVATNFNTAGLGTPTTLIATRTLERSKIPTVVAFAYCKAEGPNPAACGDSAATALYRTVCH